MNQEEPRLLRWDTAPSLLTVPEAAVLLRLSEFTIYELVKQSRGENLNPFPVLRQGKRVLIPADLLRVWVEREASPEWVQFTKTGSGGALYTTHPEALTKNGGKCGAGASKQKGKQKTL